VTRHVLTVRRGSLSETTSRWVLRRAPYQNPNLIRSRRKLGAARDTLSEANASWRSDGIPYQKPTHVGSDKVCYVN